MSEWVTGLLAVLKCQVGDVQSAGSAGVDWPKVVPDGV